MSEQDIQREISVDVETAFLDSQSSPDQHRYVFAYTITIRNQGNVAAKLLNRSWLITDSNGKVQEVHGAGVVGETPHLQPGDKFRYTSSTVIETPIGSMRGNYEMVDDNGIHFDAPIAPFSLAIPRTLH